MRTAGLDPRDESGQSVIEYILLLAILVNGFLVVMAGINRIGLAQKLMRPISVDYAAAYRYGHPKAKGFEDGPDLHPRARGGNNFRIFINPGRQ